MAFVAHWKLNDNAASTTIVDSEGSNTGNLNVNTNLRSVPGIIDRAIDFTTGGDNINCGSDASIDNIWDGGGTVIYWEYIDNYTGKVLDKEHWSCSHGGGANVVFLQHFSSNNGTWKASGVLGLGDWYQVAVTYNSDSDSNNPLMYVNGGSVIVAETSIPSGIRTTDVPHDLYLGNRQALDLRFGGKMDSVRVYNTILTPSEIQDIYNEELPGISNINNDFRMVGSVITYDITNDFRLRGAELYDINNDFRMVEITFTFGDINNDIRFALPTLYDINNKFNSVVLVVPDIDNDIRFVDLEIYDINNDVRFVTPLVPDINNDFRTKKEVVSDIRNDFRMLASWQTPTDSGFESLGKEYIKVYIDDVEQTDADIDSIIITQNLGAPHTCTFELGRAFDAGAPAQESVVEIKYHIYTLYKGYIVDVNPTAKPESIIISCQDKYWLDNRTNKYFFVGHKPTDDKELYYNTIAGGLDYLGLDSSFDGIGNFIPETINVFGVGTADAITSLITETGNYNWYYDIAQNKKLWKSGAGNIVDLTSQTIGTNLGLYQVLGHSIKESIIGLVNKLRVQMGTKVVKRFRNSYQDDGSGSKTYTSYSANYYKATTQPEWDSEFEKLSTHPGKLFRPGYGWDNREPGTEYLYQDVFTRFSLPSLDPKIADWDDEYPPLVYIFASESELEDIRGLPGSAASLTIVGNYVYFNTGYTIDYERGELILSQPLYKIKYQGGTEMPKTIITSLQRIMPRVRIWKKNYYSWTAEPTGTGPGTEDPETDVSNPLMFFTSKQGDYAQTILKTANYGQFSIQTGGSYRDIDGELISIPSWNDMPFAKDYADWELSKTCDVKEQGTIQLTIDAMCFHGIELRNRINITGVLDNPVNINSITYNIGSFTATLNVETGREYKRTASLPWHGA